MGTKKTPSKYNCLDKLTDDEPFFVLLARDPVAAWLVRIWAWLVERFGTQPRAKIEEALKVAEDMERWRAISGKPDQVAVTLTRQQWEALLVAPNHDPDTLAEVERSCAAQDEVRRQLESADSWS